MKTDIVIIGSGIAGCSAAVLLKIANSDFVILEGKMPGGMLNQLKTVENFPGLSKTTGNDILIGLMEQLRFHDIQLTYGNVQTILKEDKGFEVVTDVDSYECKAVIVATGVSQKSNNIPGEEKFVGQGVSYCATCDGNFFKGLDVAVVGNNNIALEESIYLSNLVNKVYFVCPDNKLSGDNKLIKEVQSKTNIDLVLSSNIEEILGDEFGVTGMKINGKTIGISGIFPYIGEKSTTQILNNLKPEMKGIFVKANEERSTNIPGLFVAGDIVDKKLKQLITASGDGSVAATSAIEYCKLLK